MSDQERYKYEPRPHGYVSVTENAIRQSREAARAKYLAQAYKDVARDAYRYGMARGEVTEDAKRAMDLAFGSRAPGVAAELKPMTRDEIFAHQRQIRQSRRRVRRSIRAD